MGRVYAAMALEFGLAASRGSDFHSPEESRTDLGALPWLPENLTPVRTAEVGAVFARRSGVLLIFALAAARCHPARVCHSALGSDNRATLN